ncbi:MAG TPA: condensation domain-containing protein, partial [Thermoanaerobaculia bacterium]
MPETLVAALFATGSVRRVVNLYGPSEDTTYSTGAELSAGVPVAIGRPLPGTRAHLLDVRGELAPRGVPGELHLGGAGLARGYLARPELTAERFVPDPFGGEPGGRLYRTGDLARWTAGGELVYLGRIDHQVKVRGFRIELGEIEAALLRYPDVAEAVVAARDDGDRKVLAAFVVPRAGAACDASELRALLRRTLPEHLVPAAFVRLAALPRQPNGKVDRRGLPELEPETRPIVGEAPVGAAEELLAGLVAEVLGTDAVPRHASFFDLGGDSLLASRLLGRAGRLFGVELPVRTLFEAPTVAALAALVARSTAAAPPPAPIARRAGPRESVESTDAPLSFAQSRLWFLDQLEPASAAYNLPGSVELLGPLAVPALAASLAEIVRRHEALRTVFPLDPLQTTQPVARLLSTVATGLPLVDLSALPPPVRAIEGERCAREEASRPFDLAAGPLCRSVLLRVGREQHRLLVTLHHIAADGASLAVLLGELRELYAAFVADRPSPLAPLPLQYADYAAWQRERLAGEALERDLAYWRNRLSDLEAVEVPADRPAAARPGGAVAGARSRALPPELGRELAPFARRHGVTLFMAGLAAFHTLLARYTGAERIPVGSAVAGRRPEVERLIGLFVNTLVLDVRVPAERPFAALLGEVRELCLAAYAHQELP